MSFSCQWDEKLRIFVGPEFPTVTEEVEGGGGGGRGRIGRCVYMIDSWRPQPTNYYSSVFDKFYRANE